MPPSASHSHNHFTTTRWSLVMQLDAQETGDARDAMVELCQRYWYPVYAYVRRCGHAPAIAQDITRSFLQHLLRHFRESVDPKTQGQFRRYLIGRLDAFLADDWHAAIKPDVIKLDAIKDEATIELATPPPDLEPRYQRDNADASSPEQAYQRSFALEVIGRAFSRLYSEAHKSGHLDMYAALKPFLGSDPPPGVYEELARKLHSRPLALVVALKRLRQRFRELVGAELADTVTSAPDLAAEQQTLHAVLRELHR
jgi:hypothetical protein